MPGFDLSVEEKSDVIAFLKSLTDEAFLNDARYADPNLTETRKIAR